MSDQRIETPEAVVWKKKTIGDIVYIQGGDAKATNALAEKAADELAQKATDDLAVSANSYPYIQSGDLQNTREIVITRRILKSDATNIRRVPVKCVLLAAARPDTVGRCGILSEEAIINNVTQALIPRNPQELLVDFLFYYFRLPSTQKTLRDILIHRGQTQLRRGDTEALEIFLPPLNVQRNITLRLNALTKEIQQNKSTLDQISPKITQTKGASIDKIFTTLEQDPVIERLPLRNVVTQIKHSVHSRDDQTHGEYIYVPLQGLSAGTLVPKQIKPLREINSLPAKFYGSQSSPSSTILYSLINPELRRIALVNDISNNGYITYNPNIIALTVTNPKCDPTFCMWALIAAPITQFISGMVIPRVNMTALLNYRLPLPPLAEQKRIVDTIDTLSKTFSELTKKQEEQRQKLDQLEQGIIVQALQGAS
ncbi:restriction endonuclease subunit S [Ktedonobacter robiniae]|uniref:Type I restriction modification DNA specificity domain-containing protein n=1 Tax=Ktedonobacter robiniae TaxID=2778365 RepID=A0ABQ3UTR8_9CHLR|nr:restriction endonuclease subunit S [Ktedonobacter robiniae]GHO56077.1 hypothetical protein KSB_45520 [Ktedonobacter robiniae]